MVEADRSTDEDRGSATAAVAEDLVAVAGMLQLELQDPRGGGAHGVPPEVVELLTYLFSEVMDGRNAATTDGVRRALGREPRDFGDYARAAADTGVWSASAAA